jgi:hypothetical protein
MHVDVPALQKFHYEQAERMFLASFYGRAYKDPWTTGYVRQTSVAVGSFVNCHFRGKGGARKRRNETFHLDKRKLELPLLAWSNENARKTECTSKI